MSEYSSILKDALGELHDAVRLMLTETFPRTPRPRLRRFVIIDGRIEWPYPEDPRAFMFRDQIIDHADLLDSRAYRFIMAACPTPRHVLHAVRQLRAAAAWCRARREGRLRAAQNIMRQQANAVEALDAEMALSALSK